MGKFMIIGVGGFIGAILRYQISGAVQNAFKNASFPLGTLSVNLIGCLVIGFLTYLVEYRSAFSPEMRSLVLVGILGALTTFSTFGLETFNLLSASQYGLAGLNMAANSGLGLLAVWLGRILAGIIWR